ncbi:MAG: MaoC family dehydratase N-terminal domain-containing protein [Deltaproteobacteria bacterium]|nr:MaoC family dehydratase N-terminal domain-containing protein [Deltaproteobacteria bacterium]
MALNRSLVGKSYSPIVTEVTFDAFQKYARAYNDDNRYYFAPPPSTDIMAPPMFNAVVTWLALITVLSDPDLRLDPLRLLHRSQDMQFVVPIRPDDRISAMASIISIENGAAGEIITIGLEASNQHCKPVSRTRFTALIRGRRERVRPPPNLPSSVPLSREPLLTVSQVIDLDQTQRYAEASGDRNPIHLDESVARMAGLPGIIVHGLCTMAFASKVIIQHLCENNPARLRRLAVSFSRPVFPGDSLITLVWREEDAGILRRFSYETYNAAGVPVLRDGLAEVSSDDYEADDYEAGEFLTRS